MPIEHAAHSDLWVFTIRASGRVNVRDVLHVLDAVDAEPGILDGMVTFMDCRAVDLFDIAEDNWGDIADLAVSLAYRRGLVTPTAILAPGDAAHQGASLYAAEVATRSPAAIAVHRELDAAAVAIGIEPRALGVRLDPPITLDDHQALRGGGSL